MSAHKQSAPRRRLPDGLRWAASFIVVLGLHATAAATLLRHWQPTDEAVAGGPAIVIDLAPIAAAPEAPENEAAPGPQQVRTPPDPQPEPEQEAKIEPEPQPQPEVKPDPEPEKPQIAAIEPPKEEPPVQKEEPPAPPVETPPLPETPPMIAEVVLPPPRPPQPRPEPKEQKHHRRVADLNSAPPKLEQIAPRAVAPAPGVASRDPNAVPTWKSELVARLQRYKRYPSEAQARGEQGVAQLAFSVDRSGGVHNARIVHSSGSSALDRATLDLIARAAPLPAPPSAIGGAQIAIVVPINYNLRQTR